jgi:hypothetical protein
MAGEERDVTISGMTVGLILETTVAGVPAWHAGCLSCDGWRCHQQPHDDIDTAVRCAERHQARKH